MQLVKVSEPALLIRIANLYDESMVPLALYEATRGVWRIGTKRDAAKLGLAVAGGVVKEVFNINVWHPAATTPYFTRPHNSVAIAGRWEFTGRVAPEMIRNKYIEKSVAHYFKRGASNPIMYVNI